MENYHTDILFNKTKEQVLELCKSNPLPGTNKWPAGHPIWDCNVAKKPTPRDAWSNEFYLNHAIKNLFWITNKSIILNQYPDFVKRIKNSFDNKQKLLEEVQLRFTIAKIAPKVTALMPSYFERVLEETEIDISNGIYCPMAGFSGIVEGAKRWFEKHNIEYKDKIEAYDINPNLCKWYNWIVRDVLAQTIITDKTVFVCPPFGLNTERWKGTPDNMYYDFEEWVVLIKKHIKAPKYIFIGPEKSKPATRYSSGKTPSGLFTKKVGIQFYPEYC